MAQQDSSTKRKIINIEDIKPFGFGSYRISWRSKQHCKALKLALQSGLNLIDTSSNYTDGDSELLIGKILAEPEPPPVFIITKAGYIQGKILKDFKENIKDNIPEDSIVKISDDLLHCIHPIFLENQIEQSLQRMQCQFLDAFLIHNPEYFFDDPRIKNLPVNKAQELYYERLELALSFLEKQVQNKKIRYYGISSNSFPFKEIDQKLTNIHKILEIVERISSNHHFKFIQFPYNLIENGASINKVNDETLIETSKKKNLITLANRPLNAFTQDGLLRLATYKTQKLSKEDIKDILNICFNSIEEKWLGQGEKKESLYEIPVIKQFLKIWESLPSPDAVEQVFHMHFFPLLANIWGNAGLSPEESKPFYLLYDTAIELSKEQMSVKANNFREELEKENKISNNNNDRDKPFSLICCEHYLNQGIDHVLVGMRKEEYVQDILKDYSK